MNKIKIACWFSFIALIVLIGTFHQNVLSFFYQKGIEAIAYSHFGCRLHYDDAFLKDGQLIMLSPRLDCENGFQAGRMTLFWNLDLKQRQFEIGIDLDKPQWKIDSSPNLDEEGLKKVLKNKRDRLKVFYHITIQDGMLVWSLPDGTTDNIHFDAKASSLSGVTLKAFFRENSYDGNYLSVSTSSNSDALNLIWDCHGIECKKLSSLTKLFAPDLMPLTIDSGYIFGELKTIFPYQSRPYLEGELTLEKINFTHEAAYAGSIEKAKLKFEKNHTLDQPLTTIAEIELIEPINVTAFEQGRPDWKVSDLVGAIKLNGQKNVLLNLQLASDYLDRQTAYKLAGNINLNAQRSFNFDLNLLTSSAEQPDGKIKLLVNQNDRLKNAEILLENITHVEIGFLQTLISGYWPAAKNIEFLKGAFNASLTFNVTNDGLENLRFDRFDVKNADFKLASHHSTGAFDHLLLKGAVNLTKADPWNAFNGELQLDNGRLQLNDLHHELPLTDIQAHVEVQNGEILHSLITLKWMGLIGSMDLEWGDAKELLIFNLDGHVHDISNLFPAAIQTGMDTEFKNTRLKILANFKKQQQFELNGTIHVQRNQSDQFDLINFGCEFIKSQHENQTKWIPIGRFYAHDLPLDKFISPFIFRRGVLKLRGDGEFKGSFDQDFVNIQYNAQNLQIENDNLLIEVKDLYAPSSGQFSGFHQINLNNSSHHGTLPVRNAVYNEKNTGLVFKDVQGTFYFKDRTLSLQNMEGHCEGAYFAGSLALDYTDPAPGVFSVMSDLPEISGKVSQIQSILSRLKKKTVFNDIPLEGDVSTRNHGMHLVFDFAPHDYKLKANVEASIIDSTLRLEDADMALKGLYMDIDYDHERQTLDISEIQGALLVGKPSRLEEYQFGGNHISLKDMDLQDVDLDIWIKDNSTELVRIIAQTEEVEPTIKNIILDPRSHVSAIYPTSFNCRLKNWTDIDALELTSQFELQDLINDLLLFRQTGLYFFTHSTLDKLSQIDYLKGQIALNIEKDSETDHFNYIVDAKQLQGPSQEEHQCYFKGHKREKKWVIDHLQWDDISAHAEILPEDGSLKIPFLGIKDGHSLLVGLEGEILPDECRMACQINLYEISLAHLDHWPALKDFVTDWKPTGQLKGTGQMGVEFLPKSPWYHMNLTLDAYLQDFSCKDCSFNSSQPFKILYQTGNGIKIENALLDLTPEQEKKAQINIGKLCYEPGQDQLTCSELNFNIPTDELAQVGDTLQRLFPNLISQRAKEILANLKSEGVLKGSLAFEKGSNHDYFTLRLDEGLYTFNQKNYQLEHLELRFGENDLRFAAVAHEERCPYNIKGRVDWPSLTNGEAVLVDLPTNAQGSMPPLHVKWSYNDMKGLWFHSIHGYFCGLHCNLMPGMGNPAMSSLQGQIDINFNFLRPLLSVANAEKVTELEVGDLYTFQGAFGINMKQGDSLLDRLYFDGELSGNQVVLEGFRLENLHAKLNYVPKQLDVSGFVIDDPAGRVEAERMVMQQSQQTDSWWLSIPQVAVKNLRPAILRDVMDATDQGNSRYKNLLIKRIDMQNFYGNLNDLRTWQAQGSLHFLNPTRKNAPHPLLAIPAEIILRLGLNSQVLNPVTGTISFDLRGDRFYFKRFKDVYSEGRGSKFYLAEGPTQSWMDLKGNLSVQIRMKQYNLLFKLAELFTVSVEGNLKKPKFYLQKQSKTARKDRNDPNFFD